MHHRLVLHLEMTTFWKELNDQSIIFVFGRFVTGGYWFLYSKVHTFFVKTLRNLELIKKNLLFFLLKISKSGRRKMKNGTDRYKYAQ